MRIPRRRTGRLAGVRIDTADRERGSPMPSLASVATTARTVFATRSGYKPNAPATLKWSVT